MGETQRRTQLIIGIAISKINTKESTIKSLNIAVKELKKDRPQLFQGSKGHPIYTPIKTEQDVDDLRNSMACGNYPLGMTDCEAVGINGDCGSNCPVLLRGECEYQDEMIEAYSDKQARD